MDKNSVLIVDDEAANIIALTSILSSEYDVYAAKNGPDAIILANEHLPDVILLDVLMPEMDGYEVLAALKSVEMTRSIPIIFITGLVDAADEEKGLILGASDYITKPFHSSIVRLRVQNQIQFSSQFNIVKALSLSDELTGLFNRRGFDYRLRMEMNRSRREQTPICVIMLDIDDFKEYNDTYGHLQGDAALQATANVIMQTLRRPADFSARWGGEEFIALLPDTDMHGALGVAESIRSSIEDCRIYCTNGDTSKITVSIGLNTYVPGSDLSVRDFIAGADEALYTAKRSGKNRVCKFEG